jgi:hypothetical protein
LSSFEQPKIAAPLATESHSNFLVEKTSRHHSAPSNFGPSRTAISTMGPEKLVLWRDGGVLNLQSVLDPVAGAGWTISTASAINNSGQASDQHLNRVFFQIGIQQTNRQMRATGPMQFLRF